MDLNFTDAKAYDDYLERVRYGQEGGFKLCLIQAWDKADSTNREALIKAFPWLKRPEPLRFQIDWTYPIERHETWQVELSTSMLGLSEGELKYLIIQKIKQGDGVMTSVDFGPEVIDASQLGSTWSDPVKV